MSQSKSRSRVRKSIATLNSYEYPNCRNGSKSDDWQEITDRLAQPRASISPSKISGMIFDASSQPMSILQKRISFGDTKCTNGGIPFTNLDHLTHGTLVADNSDIYYGARPGLLDRRFRDNFGSLLG
jgi:hypothetical protein